MPLQYKNRRGETYYVQEGKTPKGKPKYYTGRKLSGTPLDVLPEGYEIYEHPEHGLVYIRKSKPSAITPLEQQMALDGVRKHAGSDHVIVEVEGDSLVVWVPSMGMSEANELIRKLAGAVSPQRNRELLGSMMNTSTYTRMLRFVLVNLDRRVFAAQRWCFRGSIDDWISLGVRGSLSDLIAKYAKHLGKESFFELM